MTSKVLIIAYGILVKAGIFRVERKRIDTFRNANFFFFSLRAGITQQCDAFMCVFCPLIIHVNYDTMLIHG